MNQNPLLSPILKIPPLSDKEKEYILAIDKIMTGKSQWVRLWDIFFLGPMMIGAAKKAKGLSRWEKRVILSAGWGTIIYNGWNFYKIFRLREIAKSKNKNNDKSMV